jgi:prevent-host-death family protein
VAVELGVADLKRRFSAMLARVELNGEKVVVVKRGRAAALLGPLDGATEERPRPRRGLAAAAGAWEDYEDIDALLAALRAARERSQDRDVELER